MIDTHCRKYASGIFEKMADVFIKFRFTPNVVTVLALMSGIGASLMLYFDCSLSAIILLWISGLLDAVDGQMARKLNQSSDIGALMDILFDRIVEIVFIHVCALKSEDGGFAFMFLLSTIIISMTIFLTVGALSGKSSEKSFYYQAGLMERTETFIIFTVMVFLPQYAKNISVLFGTGILFTAGQRFYEAHKILD
ncbi:MAG: CDP-alcohol phosphatidyltransferase family protein [Proteocatella sp.]